MITSFKKIFLISLVWLVGLYGCGPKEDIVFKGVDNVEVNPDENGEPVLIGQAFFYNPNKTRMKLKEIHVDVLVNGKLSAKVRQDLALVIPTQSDFAVPLVAQLSLKELGLLDTIMNLLGGKKYEVQYIGFVRVAVHGITVKVPVKYTEEMRFKF